MDQFELRFFLQEFRWTSLIDIGIVTAVIYLALSKVRGTRAVPVLRGIILLALLLISLNLWAQFTQTRLVAVEWLIEKMLPALFVAIPVIFQEELRRFLAELGQIGRTTLWFRFRQKADTTVVDTLAEAARRLSTRRHGALIVIERQTGLQEYINTGIKIDATLTVELLLAIFYKDAELHDGGVIISQDRIAAASCVMPLSNSRFSDRQMGLRHRAALGTSEESDAVVLIVSEETGNVAIAHRGRILPRQPISNLSKILQAFLQNGDAPAAT